MPTFLLEVGTEELPADFVDSAIAQWKERIPQSLNEQCLTHGTIEYYGTPRRLGVLIPGLLEQQPDREEEVKGPPAKAAFKDGNPTPAAVGFARKQGVELDTLEVRDTDKGEFVFVLKKIPGRPATEILTELIPQWIFGLEGRRFMRWGDGDLRFPRPIRWLVTLLDGDVLPIELENGSETINSDRISYGHRILHPQSITLAQATDYVECLHSAYVMVEPEKRQNLIKEQVESAAQKLSGYAPIDKDLWEEVTNLVEWPTAVVGKIEQEFLSLPSEVVTTVMVTHQRYFPVFTDEREGKLLPNFITISNGDLNKSDIIAAGNERVIKARLADGQYFYKTDLASPLESYLPKLEKVTFQDELGSVRGKVERIEKIAAQIANQLLDAEAKRTDVLQAASLGTEIAPDILRAAKLCKADLVTQMVYEFPELQGVMGQKYAAASGEPEAVATAIFEHYLPKGASDKLPDTLTGQVVALADRLDTLVSIFGLGMIPTGSSDPFALRRAANAVINISLWKGLGINLHQLLQDISADFVATYPDKNSPVESLQEFFIQRIRTLLQERNIYLQAFTATPKQIGTTSSGMIDHIDYDLVNAVLGENDPEYTERSLKDLLDVRDRALFLQEIRNNGKLDEIYETVNRSSRLATQKGELDTQQLDPTAVIDTKLFQKTSEQAFYDAIVNLVPQTKAAQEQRNYQQLVNALAENAPTVSRFFDGDDSVLVMVAAKENPTQEELAIQRNRLNLLGLLRNHARVLADFGAIVKS